MTSPLLVGEPRGACETRILLGEGEIEFSKILVERISGRGYTVRCARSGAQAARMLTVDEYALAVLDTRLPDPECCAPAAIRSAGRPLVLMLTSQNVAERVRCLDNGADDCIARPLSVAELLARIQALLRRRAYARAPAAVVELGDLRIDLGRHKVYRRDRSIDLGAREFELLAALAAGRRRAVPRAVLCEEVWGAAFSDDGSNRIDVAIRRLRAKIDDPFPDKLIRAVRGVGYMLTASDASRRRA